MFITKMSLPRRTFLQGVGATVALPFLEAMVPALTPAAKAATLTPKRFGGVYVPHGAIMDQWTPAAGRGFEFTNRISLTSRQLIQRAQIVMADRIVRNESHHLLELSDRLFMLPVLLVNDTEVEPRVGELRIALLDGLQLLDAFSRLARAQQRETIIQLFTCRVRRKLKCSA